MKFGEIMAAIGRALAVMVQSAPKLIWNAARKTWEVSKEVVAFPFTLAGAALGNGGGGQPSPAQAAQQAAAATRTQGDKAESEDVQKLYLARFRRMAGTLARGDVVSAEELQHVPENLGEVLGRLRNAELRRIAVSRLDVLAGHVSGKKPIEGVRPFAEILSLAAPSVRKFNPAVAARVAAMRGPSVADGEDLVERWKSEARA